MVIETVRPGDRHRFGEHASPQAIEANLAAARKSAERHARYVAWLEDLLATRKAEVAAGTWPPGSLAEEPPALTPNTVKEPEHG